MLIDSFGRRVRYLRVSLTERCNFGCVYCVPREGLDITPDSASLSRAQIVRFARIATRLGIEKVRLTGGEPLLRRDLADIIRDLKSLTELQQVSLTTNGSLLTQQLPSLAAAGLDRINISLDRLDARRFQEITGSALYERVLEGAFQALNRGMKVKLNMVMLRDLSEVDVLRFVQLAYEHPLEVRFLEFMPLCGSHWDTSAFLPVRTVREMVQRNFALRRQGPRGDEVAEVYDLAGGKGRVGFIGSISESFCNDCSRLRLTTDGRIQACLFSGVSVPVGPLLRDDVEDEAIANAIVQAVSQKPRGNQFLDLPFDGTGMVPLPREGMPLIHNLGG